MNRTDPSAPLHLALLASGQIMPNLESVVALAARQALAGVHVYWTDFRDSRRAAQALERILGVISGQAPFSRFAIMRGATAGTGQIEDVVAWVRGRIDAAPGTRWVLNATGGTKPMAAGFLVLADHRAVEAVLYRELSARSWSVLARAADDPGGYATTSPPACYGLDSAGELLDHLPLTELLRAQMGVPDLRIDPRPVHALTPDELDAWLAALDPQASRPFSTAWLQAGLDAGRCGQLGEGALFELLFHAVLQRFGFGALAHSVELRRDRPGQTLPAHNELDLIVRHHGRLRVLDLKLTGPGGPSLPANDQIRTVAEATRTLAGIDARAIMLRPNWPPREEVVSYARQVHRVSIVDATDMPRVFELLATELDYRGPLPKSALRLQEFFAARLALGLPVDSESPALPRAQAAGLLIALQEELDQMHRLRQSHWAMATLGEGVLLSLDWSLSFDPNGTDLAQRLKALRPMISSFSVFTNTDQRGLIAIRGIGRKRWAQELAEWTPRLRDSRQALRALVAQGRSKSGQPGVKPG